MNLQIVRGQTVRVCGLGDVDLGHLQARRDESKQNPFFLKPQSADLYGAWAEDDFPFDDFDDLFDEEFYDLPAPTVQSHRPISPQWGRTQVPPAYDEEDGRLGLSKQEWPSYCWRFNNNWKRHRRHKWRRTHLRRNTGELITTLKY